MSYWPYYASPPGSVHPLHAVSIHPNYTQTMHPTVTQQAPNLHPDAHQAGTSSSDAFVRVLGGHIDRTLAATQAMLVKRLSAQDAQLAHQQETLDSISRNLSAVRGEITEIHDSVKIGTYDNGDRIEKLTKAIGDSFKKLCNRTREEFREIKATNGTMLGVIEESLEALREEVKDPHANCNPAIPRVVYRDASVAPTPSYLLPVSASHIERDMADCGTDDVYDQEIERNNPAEGDRLSPEAIMVDASEDREVSYPPMLNAPVTINPLETLHDPSLHVPLFPIMSGGSSTTSTLPDPRSLLNTVESKSPKKKSKPRAQSLLSLSSLSTLSDYAPPAQISAETSLFKLKSSPIRLGKRRRSSPSPARGKMGKRARAGNMREVKREMIGAASFIEHSKDKPRCSWPEKVTETKESIQLIECNKCKNWYHWGCTGIRKNDSRLETGNEFVCPPCKFQVKPDTTRRTNDKGICARPDCEINENSDEVYVIEGLIGRYDPMQGGNRARNLSWLIKWDGYPANQSTWTPQRDIADAASLVESFEKAARTEGLQIQGRSFVLLKEAVQAGWQTRKV